MSGLVPALPPRLPGRTSPRKLTGQKWLRRSSLPPFGAPGPLRPCQGVGRLLLCSCQVHWLRAFTMTLTLSASRPLHIRPRRTWRGGGAPSCVGSALGDISMTLQGVQPAAGGAAASPSPTGSPFGILWLFMPLASGLGLRARSLGGACPESPPFPASGLPEPQLAGHPCAPHTCRGDPISSSRKSFL